MKRKVYINKIYMKFLIKILTIYVKICKIFTYFFIEVYHLYYGVFSVSIDERIDICVLAERTEV